MQYDPKSITDYLRAKGFDPSFEARRRLWEQFIFDEIYIGSSQQNTRLLNSFKFADSTPKITLEQVLYNEGEELFATVTVPSEETITLENHFGQQSMDVQSGQRIRLGKLDRVGIFAIRAKTNLLATEMALVAIPTGLGIEVGIWSASYEYSEPTISIPFETGDDGLLEKLINNLTPPIINLAWEVAYSKFFTVDKWFGLGFDVAIGGIITIISPIKSQGVVYIWNAGLPEVADFSFVYMLALIDIMTVFDDAEEERLRIIIKALQTGVNIRRVWKNIKDAKKATDLCGKVSKWIAAGDTTNNQFEVQQPDGVRVAGGLIRNSFNKSITLFCEITNPRP